MFMRILALVAVVWSFVGMPMLCRAGVLVECCDSGVPARGKSHDTPVQRPCKCPNEKCPENTGPSEPRDCDSCTESCNGVSPHSKHTDDDDLAITLVAAPAATQALADERLPHRYRSHDASAEQLLEHLPYPVSDRPLLI